MRRSDSYRATWLPEDDALLEYDEAMQRLLLPLAAALALSACAPDPFAPHKDLVGQPVKVVFGPNSYTTGILQPDGSLKIGSGTMPKSVNWDRAILVHYFPR